MSQIKVTVYRIIVIQLYWRYSDKFS